MVAAGVVAIAADDVLVAITIVPSVPVAAYCAFAGGSFVATALREDTERKNSGRHNSDQLTAEMEGILARALPGTGGRYTAGGI